MDQRVDAISGNFEKTNVGEVCIDAYDNVKDITLRFNYIPTLYFDVVSFIDETIHFID